MTMTYDAMGFHKDLPKGRCSGQLRFSTREVIFTFVGGSRTLPISGIKVRLGGANDRLIFFEHPSLEDWSIYTTNHSVLDEPIFQQDLELREALAKIRTKKNVNRGILVGVPVILAALLVLIIGGIYVARPWIVDKVAAQVPVSWEETLGETAFDQHVDAARLLDGDEISADLKAFTDILTTALPDSDYNYQFYVMEDPTLNAFALPGGKMVLHTGTILQAETGEEVLGVVAHEIAHVTERHSIHAIIDKVGIVLLVQLFLGDASGLVGLAALALPVLSEMEFSRDNEREADGVGLAYLEAAEVNPEGMIRFFERIYETHETNEASEELQHVMSMLSTHPTTSERIAWLRAQINDAPSVQNREDIAVAFDKLKKSLEAELASNNGEQ